MYVVFQLEDADVGRFEGKCKTLLSVVGLCNKALSLSQMSVFIVVFILLKMFSPQKRAVELDYRYSTTFKVFCYFNLLTYNYNCGIK